MCVSVSKRVCQFYSGLWFCQSLSSWTYIREENRENYPKCTVVIGSKIQLVCFDSQKYQMIPL